MLDYIYKIGIIPLTPPKIEMELKMIGNVYSRLTVQSLDHIDKKYNKYWKCLCSCGNTSIVKGHRLTGGKTKSCGCYMLEFRQTLVDTAKQERRNVTHKSYNLIMQRCYDTTHKHYSHYGAVGITVCDRWKYGENNKTGWECFFEDMGPKPLNYILGRINKLKPFDKENCKWTTSNNQFADILRSGRPRIKEPKVEKELSVLDAWVKRCLTNPKRKALTTEYVLSLITTHCALLEVELDYVKYIGLSTPKNYASLDKIDPTKGYVEGNVQIISHRANMIKNDATLEELDLIVKNWKARL